MPVDDAEPRYQFADPDGNVSGSIYFDEATDEARLAFDDGTEVVLGTPTQVGSSTTPGVFESVSTDELSVTEQSAKIYATSSQTVSSRSVVGVTFDSEDTDHTPGDVLTVDVANNLITIEKAGLYLVTGVVEFPSPTDGMRVLGRITVGGSNIIDVENGATTANTGSNPTTVTSVSSTPADVKLETFQDSGGNKSTSGAERNEHLVVSRIG